jgi:hypothetical protein
MDQIEKPTGCEDPVTNQWDFSGKLRYLLLHTTGLDEIRVPDSFMDEAVKACNEVYAASGSEKDAITYGVFTLGFLCGKSLQ